MDFHISISGFVALYVFMLAGFAGWVIIGRVPAILHTPLMSGSNFVHGIVVVGGISTLLQASSIEAQAIGFLAVLLGAGNAAGGYAVTERMLAMFQPSAHPDGGGRKSAAHKTGPTRTSASKSKPRAARPPASPS
jgi:NAD(P) transhydrogenase subunit alpha